MLALVVNLGVALLLVIDFMDLKVYGESEWKVRKQG